MRTLRLPSSVGGLLLAVLILLPSSALLAQVASEQPVTNLPVPIRLRAFEGTVTIQRATGGETAGAEVNLPLDAGDRLWTDALGRAELVLPDGGVMWVNHLTTIDVVSLPRSGSDGEIILRLWNGTTSVSRWASVAAGLRIDTADASVRVEPTAHVRLDVDEERKVWLSVYDGRARMSAGGLTEVVSAGERTLAEPGTAPAETFAFNTAEQDDFDRWQAERFAALASTERHVRRRDYVPQEIAVHAADLETNGSWFYYDDFNAWAWRPTTVAVTWAPYRNGRWVYGYGGWSWVSASPWGWVTGHYGRWHHLPARGWVWFPGGVYSSAWVSWGVSGGYVGWSPVGFWGVPLVSINLWFGGHYGYGGGYHGHYNYPWNGYYPGYGRPGGGVAVPRGKVVAGRGYTRGGASPEAWSFVRSGDLGRRDVGSRAVPRDAVQRGGNGSVQINGPLRPRDPSGLAVGGGRAAVARGDGPRIGTGRGNDVRVAVGRPGGNGASRPSSGDRAVIPRPGGGASDRPGAGSGRPAIVRPDAGSGRPGIVRPGTGSGRPAIVRPGQPARPDRSTTIRPDAGRVSPPRAAVPRGDTGRGISRPGGRAVAPRPGAPGSRGVTIRPSTPDRSLSRPPRAAVNPRGVLGSGSRGSSPYTSPRVRPRAGSAAPRGGATRSMPGLSRPSASPGRSPGISPRSGGRSVVPRVTPRMPSRPQLSRPGGGSPGRGAISRGSSPRGTSGGRSAGRLARPRGRQ